MFNVLKTKKTLDSLLVLEQTENRAFMAAIQIQNSLVPPAAGTGALGTGCADRCALEGVLPGSPAPARGLYLEPQAPRPGLTFRYVGNPVGSVSLTRPKWGILLGSRRVGSCSLVAW